MRSARTKLDNILCIAAHKFRGTFGWRSLWIILALGLLVVVQLYDSGAAIRSAVARGDVETVGLLLATPIQYTCVFAGVLASITALVVGSRAWRTEAGQRTLLVVLSRPVSRTQLLWGLALGVCQAMALIVVSAVGLCALAAWLVGVAPGETFVLGAASFLATGVVWGGVSVALAAHFSSLTTILIAVAYLVLLDSTPGIAAIGTLLSPAKLPAEVQSTMFSPASLVAVDGGLVGAVIIQNVLLAAAALTLSALLSERGDLRMRK